MTRPGRTAPIIACCLVVLGACGDGDQAAQPSLETIESSSTTASTTVTTTASTTVTTTVSTTSTSEPPATTGAPATSTVPTTSNPPTTSTVAVTSSTPGSLPAFPPQIEELTHGGEVWVVVLAGSEVPDDPALGDAVAAASEAGYTTGSTDCDAGAAEALGMPDGGVFTVSVYLASEADARTAAEAFRRRGVDGVVVQVQTFCLD